MLLLLRVDLVLGIGYIGDSIRQMGIIWLIVVVTFVVALLILKIDDLLQLTTLSILNLELLIYIEN